MTTSLRVDGDCTAKGFWKNTWILQSGWTVVGIRTTKKSSKVDQDTAY